MTCKWKIVFLLLFPMLIVSCSAGQLTTKEHRTHAAIERKDDVLCYQCNTVDDGEKCDNLTRNTTNFARKCKDDLRICMVKQYSYTMSTENSTSEPMMWALERNCTSKHACEPGCIVIGERTKLYACTSCCEKSLCNTGKGAANKLPTIQLEYILTLLLHTVLCLALSR